MQKFYNNKNIIITGAASGVGKDLALLFSSWKANLALIDFNLDGLKDVAESCRQNKVDVHEFHCDVSDINGMEVISEKILNSWNNNIDIVIANAGVGGLNPGYNLNLHVHKKVVSFLLQKTHLSLL